MSIKKYLINFLGGLTKSEHEEKMNEFKKECEDFAAKFLVGRSPMTCYGYGAIEHVEICSALTILGSNLEIRNTKMKEIIVAPWVSGCFIQAQFTGGSGFDMNRKPEFIHVSS